MAGHQGSEAKEHQLGSYGTKLSRNRIQTETKVVAYIIKSEIGKAVEKVIQVGKLPNSNDIMIKASNNMKSPA